MHSMPPLPARHALMDAGRGFAILGILWLNIFIFAVPYGALAIPDIWGDTDPVSSSLNVETWRMVGIFVDGVMRAMISILFGASALIMMANAARSESGLAALDPYYRRLLWLIAFGLVHAYLLLWPYDILYLYGLFGLFLFPFRNLKSRTLVVLAAVLMAGSVLHGAYEHYQPAEEPARPVEALSETAAGAIATISAAAGITPDAEETESLQQLVSDIEEEIAARHEGYFANMAALAPQSFTEQTTEVFAHHFLDVVSFMFLGMALLNTGFLTGAWTTRRYGTIAAAGYGLGWIIGYLSNTAFAEGSLVAAAADTVSAYGYDFRRLAFALAHLSLLALALKAGRARWLTSRLEACGRMALTLYIAQTVACIFLFYGFGFALFGTLEHFEVALIAAAMTAAQLIGAPLYLCHLNQGPLERLIRWLVDSPPAPAVAAKPAPARARAR